MKTKKLQEFIEQEITNVDSLFKDVKIIDVVEYDLKEEYLRTLGKEEMAVYSFWDGNSCLKVGQAGAHSNARYRYQHFIDYTGKRTYSSTLAKSLKENESNIKSDEDCVNWMKEHLNRLDIIVAATDDPHSNKIILNYIEGLMQFLFNPKYEGGKLPNKTMTSGERFFGKENTNE